MTVQEVYLLALKLMGEESADGTDEGYTDEYMDKSCAVLTVLQAELLPPSVIPSQLNSKTDLLQVDDHTARLILPYGLAAHLLLEEDQNRASFFNARYDELKKKRKSTITAITDTHNVLGGLQ